MKKIYIYLTAFVILLTSVVSCGDNVDVSVPHDLTQEEIDELARQDSIREANRNKIDADLILEYEVKIVLPHKDYPVTDLYIDVESMAGLFGMTTEELAEGITNIGDEIIGFCIESSGLDKMTATNTNSVWGHRWDANSNVVDWGSSAKVYTEYDPKGGYFVVGQYEGQYEGEKIRMVECLKYNDLRVAVVINVYGKQGEEYVDPETPPAGDPYSVIKDYEVTLTSGPYDGEDIDVKEVLRDAFKMTTYQIYQAIEAGELVMKGLNADGSVYLTDKGEVGYTANYPGHWFNILGDVCTWGSEGFAYFCELHASEEELLLHPGIGDSYSDGDEYRFTQVAELNGGQVTFNVTIKIVD